MKMVKILIVDDSAFARNSISMMVESGGHEVVGRAEDGEQALKLFKSLHPELVMLDYLMPGKNGEVVLKEIIQHDPSARVIMISGSGDKTIEERALQTGAKVFVKKPCVPRDLLKVIDQVMEI
ncbi:MAG: response regulator [Proteobacteria bacterium]|nr:response regulator [Pseudomonadota bacterium]